MDTVTAGLPKYWTLADRAEVDRATTMAELAAIALRVIRRIPQPVVQVCGPITTGGCGTMEGNLALFEKAIKFLEGQRFLHVFNQLPFQEAMVRIVTANPKPSGEYDWEILEEFYRPIFESGLIARTYFLPLWHTSTGACWERQAVTDCEIPIVEFLEKWFSDHSEC